MSWSDDDFDVDEVVKKDEPAPKAAPKVSSAYPKAKPKPKTKPKAEYDVPLEDKEAERLRQRRLQEQADERLITDFLGDGAQDDVEDQLFADADEEEVEIREDITDTFENVSLESTKELEDFTKAVVAKLGRAKVPTASHKYVYEIVKALEQKLKIAECEELQKTLTGLLKEKRKTSAQKAMADKKANDITKKNAKIDIHGEMNMMYGDDEDWEEEEAEEDKDKAK